MWCPAWSSAEEISKTVPSSILRSFFPHNLALWCWWHLQYGRELPRLKLSTFVQIFFSLANQLDDCSIASLLKNLIETLSSVKIEIRYMNLPYLVQIVLKHTVHMQKKYANWINSNLRMKEAWDSNYSRQYLCCNIYSNFIKHLQDQIDHDENPQKIIQIWNCRENSTHFSSGQPKQTRHGSY